MNKVVKKFLVSAAATAMVTAFTSAAMASETIKIGVVAPNSGGSAAFGQQQSVGAQAAADAVNAKGGINGKKIELIIADDACDPKQAVFAANRLVDQEKVVAVVGHFCSSGTMPASEIYDEANILNITPASTNPRVTERDLSTILRTCGRDDQQAAVVADFIANTLKAKRIAVLNDKETYGVGLANATRDAVKQLGIEVVLEDGVTRGERDYNALVTKVKGANVDAVFFGGLYAEAGLLVRQIRQQGITVPFVSDDGIVDPSFITAAGGVANAEGVFMSLSKDPRDGADSQEAIEQLKQRGSDGGGFTLYSYAAVQAIAAALSANDGVTDGTKLADWLKDNEVDTVLGKKSWDERGDLKTNDYIMYVWNKDGQYVPYK